MQRWLLLLLPIAAALAADAAPTLDTVLQRVRAGYRSDDAIRVMREVYSTDRYFTFPRFHQTAEYLKRKMQEAGLAKVELVDTPADGVTQVGYWTMPLAWDARSARLEILTKSAASLVPAASRVLADYRQVPASLGMWSVRLRLRESPPRSSRSKRRMSPTSPKWTCAESSP